MNPTEFARVTAVLVPVFACWVAWCVFRIVCYAIPLAVVAGMGYLVFRVIAGWAS